MDKYITVQQFNEYISGILSEDAFLYQVSVAGEVSGMSVVSGTAYFTLKDKNAMLSAVCFNCARTYQPKNGEKVIVAGRADFYVKGGRLSLNAYQIVPFGAGDIHRKLELLKEKLLNEGLFDPGHKKPVPKYPIKICIITSLKGAALQDMLSTMYRKNTVQQITVADVRVQGEHAAAEITKALNNADKKGFDVIVISRGGGSLEDLFPFNDETLLRTIYNAKTPIISAVGHETDYMLCDMVADERAITPTAAAERIAFDMAEMLFVLDNYKRLLKSEMAEKLSDSFRRMSEIRQTLKYRSKSFIYSEQKEIDLAKVHLKTKLSNRFLREENNLTSLLKILSVKNPARLLQDGYFRAETEDKAIKGVSGLKKGDSVRLYAYDGCAEAKIESVTLSNNDI